MRDMIGSQDIIYDLLTERPELVDTLVSVSNKFGKMKNPLLLNTAGRVTTVEKAAKTAGVYLNELLFRLNEAIGKGDEFARSVKAEALKGKHTGLENLQSDSVPDWYDKVSDLTPTDLRLLTEEPFFRVTEEAKNLHKGQGLAFTQAFPPLPLASFLKKEGFGTYIKQNSNTQFILYVYRKEG